LAEIYFIMRTIGHNIKNNGSSVKKSSYTNALLNKNVNHDYHYYRCACVANHLLKNVMMMMIVIMMISMKWVRNTPMHQSKLGNAQILINSKCYRTNKRKTDYAATHALRLTSTSLHV